MHVTILQAVVLGLIQGVTEFLPVSSSGHLILVPSVLGWDVQSVAFDAVIHLATLSAVFVAFWDDVKKISAGMLSRKRSAWGNLGWFILLGTIPVGVVGVLWKDQIEGTLRDPRIVAGSLLFWGIVLFVADRISRKTAQEPVEAVGWRRAFLIGCAQAIALIPGTSRSGITISAGLFSGLSRTAAARFSFLLGIPAIAAGGLFAILDAYGGGAPISPVVLLAGFVTAFVSGLLSIRWLLKMLARFGYAPFAVYRVVLAVLLFMMFT